MNNDISNKKRTIYRFVGILVIMFAAFSFCGCAIASEPTISGNSEEVHVESELVTQNSEDINLDSLNNSFWDLSVPTQITKIGPFYFIVDCYHNQVIYHDNLSDPIGMWQVMTRDINLGHTVATDGEVCLVDDTENNRVLVFEVENNMFVNTQVFNNIGTRPHYIVYNEADKSFYAWSSMTGQMYVFNHDNDSTRMYISRIMTISELEGVYVRSFTIENDKILLVSGKSQIIEADINDFKIKKVYPVPDSMAGMIQIMPVENGYYITVSTDVNGNQDFATILYTESLEKLESGEYTDVYSYFVGGGTPYYMGKIDDRYYLTEHRLPGHSIWSFTIGADGMPSDVVAVY